MCYLVQLKQARSLFYFWICITDSPLDNRLIVCLFLDTLDSKEENEETRARLQVNV